MGTTIEVASLPEWPSTLPVAPLISAYAETHKTLVTAVTTSNKSVLIRKNATRAQPTFTVDFNLTAAQTAFFETFFYDTLEGGAIRFTFKHPRLGTNIEVSFDPTQDSAFTIDPQGGMENFKITTKFLVWN